MDSTSGNRQDTERFIEGSSPWSVFDEQGGDRGSVEPISGVDGVQDQLAQTLNIRQRAAAANLWYVVT